MNNMNGTQLRTIEQIEQLLTGCTCIERLKSGGDCKHDEHINLAL